MTIRLLIDGYNLLHATGAVRRGGGPTALARARDRMLAQIGSHYSDSERLGIQVVFDASRTRTEDSELNVRGMTVSYAVGHEEADDLLELIIRQHSNPRLLTVVSSDLRVQRCATARKARAIGSDQWLMELMDKQPLPESSQGDQATPQIDEPKHRTLSSEEVKRWLEEFGLEE